MLPNQTAPTLDKWKLIQFAVLDMFDNTDEELKTIGMSPLDIKQFREWQKKVNKTES